MSRFKHTSNLVILTLFFALTLPAFSQDTIKVSSGLNHLSMALDTSEAGDIVLLMTDGGMYEESSSLIINQSITIEAAPSLKKKPVIASNEGGYIISTKAGLNLKGVILNGTRDTLTNFGGISIDSAHYTIRVTNCEFLNFKSDTVAGGYGISNRDHNGKADSLIVSNCIFKGILNNGISISVDSITESGALNYLSVENSTFTEISGHAILLNNQNTISGSHFLVDHCTFSASASSSGILANHTDSISVKNCIAYSNEESGGIAFDLDGKSVSLKNSIYFNLAININGRISNCKSVDPLFVEASYGNFTLFKNSQAIQAGDDGSTLGDPHWGVSPYLSTQLMFVKEPYSMSPTTNSVRIVWQTPERRPTVSIVEFGTTEELGKKIMGNDGWLVKDEGYIHEVTLTGLEPFTQYYYRVSDGTKQSSIINSTKSAPQKGTDFRVMAISDTHDNSGKVWQEISKRAVLDTLDLAVYIGDLANNSNIRTTWNNGFSIPGKPLLSKCASIYAMGNHDTNHGPTTVYDYFSMPTHPENGDDPEAYYSMDYGDVKMIILNLTEDEISPAFDEGSPQYVWLENELKIADTKWIFVFTHVNLLSTGMHSQWSANHKKFILPLLEKYTSEGKHILVIGGHEHNFEHLYKNGIDHIRAGCANTIRRDQYTIVDLPFSKYFKNTSGYSTFDVSDSGNVVSLLARDSTGTVFYSAKFDARNNYAPAIYLNEPNGFNDSTSTSYTIRWEDSDPDNNAKISLFYTTDSMNTTNGVLITDTLFENDSDNSYKWDVGIRDNYREAPNSYYIYAVISDSINDPIISFSKGKITIAADSVAPLSAVNLEGNYAHGKIHLNWENPTGTVPYQNVLANFEDSLDGFSVQSTDTTLLELLTYESGNALRVHYKIPKATIQFSAIQQLPGFPNFDRSQSISFWFRGDSTENKLLFIARQDNDRNGISDDWWCSDTLNLISTDWQQVIIPFESMIPYPKHPNSKTKFDGGNMFSFDYSITVASPDSGYFELDSVKLTGNNPIEPDFKGVGLFRRSDNYPVSWNDGELIYKGNAENCTDSSVHAENKYFYTLFAYDYASNVSMPDTTAFWESDFLLHGSQLLYADGKRLYQNYPNPFKQSTTIKFAIPKSGMVKINVYNLSGQKVTTLLNNYFEEGEHKVVFNASQAGINSTGTYYYTIETNGFVDTKKMLLLR